MRQLLAHTVSLILLTSQCLAFDIVPIPDLGGGRVNAQDINNSNIIVGISTTPDTMQHGFSYDLNNNMLTNLNTSTALGINSQGDITGLQAPQGYLLPANSNTPQILPFTPPITIHSFEFIPIRLVGRKLNDCRIICGTEILRYPTIRNAERPIVFIPNKGTFDIGLPSTNSEGTAVDINAKSFVVGFTLPTDPSFPPEPRKALLWKINSCTFSSDIVDKLVEINLGVGTRAQAFAINDRDQVVGSFTQGGPSQAFIWTEAGGGFIIDLSSLEATDAAAHSINNLGVVAGAYTDAGGNFRAFVWRVETGPVDLGITSTVPLSANGINDLGVVIVTDDTNSVAIFTKNLNQE